MTYFFIVISYSQVYLGGTLTRYGKARRWTIMKERIGRTKPSRAPDKSDSKRTRNDGRPPDTVKELLGAQSKRGKKRARPMIVSSESEEEEEAPKSPKKVKKTQTALVTVVQQARHIPLYPWRANSCWLDSSLAILHAVFDYAQHDLCDLLTPLSPKSLLFLVYTLYLERQELDITRPDVSTILSNSRDFLRRRLKENRIIKKLSGFECLYVSIICSSPEFVPIYVVI